MNDRPPINPRIDKALDRLMTKMHKDENYPPDIAVKIINAAIAWEKAKHAIIDKEESFDPDNL